MNTNERNTDATGHTPSNGSQINSEGFNPQQSAEVETREVSLVQATAGLGVLSHFVNQSQMRAVWDLCRNGE